MVTDHSLSTLSHLPDVPPVLCVLSATCVILVTASVAQGERVYLLLRRDFTFTLHHKKSFLAQSKSEIKVNMSREGNRDTLKSVCMLKPEGCTVGDFFRRELRDLKTGQHVNKQETAEREMTAHERNYSRGNGTCNARSEVRDVSQGARSDKHIHAEHSLKQQTLIMQ